MSKFHTYKPFLLLQGLSPGYFQVPPRLVLEMDGYPIPIRAVCGTMNFGRIEEKLTLFFLFDISPLG